MKFSVSDLPDQIASEVSVDCWAWTGWKNEDGYGYVQWRGKNRRVHRVVYELLVGPIPKGLTLDHLCGNRACARPDHLEPVSLQENVRRGRRHNGNKTHCPQGHPYSEENTYVGLTPRGTPKRTCRTCVLEAAARRRAKAAS